MTVSTHFLTSSLVRAEFITGECELLRSHVGVPMRSDAELSSGTAKLSPEPSEFPSLS